MAKYTVAVEWIMWTDVDVEAESLDEAIRLVEAMPDLPKNGEYLESSFKVNREITEENNSETTPAFIYDLASQYATDTDE